MPVSTTRNSEIPSTPSANLMSSDDTQVWLTTNWKPGSPTLELHEHLEREAPATDHAGEQHGDEAVHVGRERAGSAR